MQQMQERVKAKLNDPLQIGCGGVRVCCGARDAQA